MTRDHLSITGPEDILGFIPHTLGYWPANSLVAMTMQGKRLGATLRVDLPPPGQVDSGCFADNISNYLQADEDADGSLLVLFVNDGWEGTAGHFELLAALECALELSGMPVRDAWLVGEAYWRNAYCTDSACCPLPGRSLDEIRDSRLNAEMVFRGSSVGPGPNTPAGRRGWESEGCQDPSLADAELAWQRIFSLRRGSRRQFDAVLDAWTLILAEPQGESLPTDTAGFLRASLSVPSWRDAVLVMSAAGLAAAVQGAEDFGIFEDLAERADGQEDPYGPAQCEGAVETGDENLEQVRQEIGEETGEEPLAETGAATPNYGEVLLGLAPRLPDWTRMARLEQLLARLAEYDGGEARAAALTCRGWIEWCRGRGSFADSLLVQANEVLPGYRLAELLTEVVRRGTVCGWAARREAAWQGMERDAA